MDKSRFGVNHGWEFREYSYPQTIVVHTTNGRVGTGFGSEANFLYTTDDVSAHFLVGKDGQIVKFLDPLKHRAWHAGAVITQRWNNNNSIGIECHYTPGEGIWPSAMRDSLTELVKYLMAQFHITLPANIETHRYIAIPKGRKVDPSGFPDAEFYVWRSRLFEPDMTHYRVISPEVNVRMSPKRTNDNIAGTLYAGDEFYSAAIKMDENGEYISGKNTWAHVTKGFSRGKPVDGLGFVHTSVLQIV